MPKDTLFDMLARLGNEDILPMHMPGHKRALSAFPWLSSLGGAFDITETEGFDDLNAPEGVLRDMEERAARLWGSRAAYLSVNGSTGGMFAALSACGRGGVLIARNCHRSVFNAAEKLGLRAEYLMPSRVEGYGIFGEITPDEAAKRLRETGCKALVVTSPTYEGVTSDISALAEAAHSAGALLIADAAHGAHLGLSEAFPPSAVREGADIVVTSLHKTLPALTQTALLHVCSERADVDDIAAGMATFCTSSPSYVLMASVDGMLRYFENGGSSRLDALADALSDFRKKACVFRRLRVLGAGDKEANTVNIDASKIYIDCIKCGFSGHTLKRRAREEFGIELEYAGGRGALAYATIGDDEGSLNRLFAALSAIDGEDEPLFAESSYSDFPPFGERVLPLGEAALRGRGYLPLEEAEGRIAAESVYVYPPGVPVLLPGERVTAECVGYLLAAKREGAEVAAPRGVLRGKLRVTVPRE